jgi:hypothetical protein
VEEYVEQSGGGLPVRFVLLPESWEPHAQIFVTLTLCNWITRRTHEFYKAFFFFLFVPLFLMWVMFFRQITTCSSGSHPFGWPLDSTT